jgi:hypothetical protein
VSASATPGMSAPSPRPVTAALRQAHVVVVLNASDRQHYAVSGERPYHEACPPWARLTFLADHDVRQTLGELLDAADVDAVVFGSNALTGAASQRAIAERRHADHWKGRAEDIGVLVLHQYLRPGAALPLEFLGGAAFSLIGEKARRVERGDIRFDSDWRFATGAAVETGDERFLALSQGYPDKQSSVWARFDFKYPGEWQSIAWEHGGGPLVAVCHGGDRVVAASRVPIDLMGAHELLGSLIAACLRPRGCLVVEAPSKTGSSTFSTALASALDRDRFVHHVRPDFAEEVDPGRAPFSFFDELIVAPEWPLDEMVSMTEEAVLGKLEEGGSIVATFRGPAGPAAIRLAGQPQYARRANELAAWLVPRLDEFRADIWSMRALAEAVVATREAFVDERLLPQALRVDFVRRQLCESLVGRISEGNVDEIVLSTVGTYAALEALGAREQLDAMRAWIDNHLDGDKELPSVVAQALTLVSGLKTPARLDRVRDAALGRSELPAKEDTALLGAYAAMLLGDEQPALFDRAATAESLGLGVQAELLRAAVRERLPVGGAIADLAARVRSEVDRVQASEHGALEAVCIGNAALIELARKQGITPTVAVPDRPREVDVRSIVNTELVKDRQDALQQAEKARTAGRLATTALAGLLVLITLAAIGVIIGMAGGNPGAKFGFATGVFGLMSSLIGFVTKKARDAGIPPWPL